MRPTEKFLSDKEPKASPKEMYSFYENLKDIEVAYAAYSEKGKSVAAQKGGG